MKKGLATGGRKLEEMAQEVAQMEEDGVAGEHMKAMWAGQSNVLVAVRVRPLLKHDKIKKNCVRVMDAKVVCIMDPAHDKQDVLRANRSREKNYAFDYVFEAGSSQESVYHHTSKFLIQGVLDGYNATVFAYGNTGAGKTYTMIGSKAEPGIMVRVMDDLFKHSKINGESHGVNFRMNVSFIEVYNENIRDLLSDSEEYLDLREDPIAGPTVAGIAQVDAQSSDEIMLLLQQGNARRTQQATAANEVSSRSHAVLQVVVECKDNAPGTVAKIKVSKLSLVDLAGSERAANTKNSGIRLIEGANINRSLLALGNCINALGEKGNKGNFVPFRDSKLTRLLKDSLGGNCRTVMIANISSAESSFEETLNTLKYANRAKNIKTHVKRNVLNVNHHISEYVSLISNLRSEIQVLKDQIVEKAPRPGQSVEPSLTPHDQPPPHDQGQQQNNQLNNPPSPLQSIRQSSSTPLEALRQSMRSATSYNRGTSKEGREVVNNMRQRIVENFQERMQLRRSLIELEDQNVQNSIEVSKRQLIVMQWSEDIAGSQKSDNGNQTLGSTEMATVVLAHGPPDVKDAMSECDQLKKAISKNNALKRNIAKRLRKNERDAESFRSDLGNKVTGEDRKELMELQYQVGKLELENMELEQHRIVHESILKGKDLAIHKLKLQLAVKDKIIKRQKAVLEESGLNKNVGYTQLAAMERALMAAESEFPASPLSPPKDLSKGISRSKNNPPKMDLSAGFEIMDKSATDDIVDNYHILSNPNTSREVHSERVVDDIARNDPYEWPEFEGKNRKSPKGSRAPPIDKARFGKAREHSHHTEAGSGGRAIDKFHDGYINGDDDDISSNHQVAPSHSKVKKQKPPKNGARSKVKQKHPAAVQDFDVDESSDKVGNQNERGRHNPHMVYPDSGDDHRGNQQQGVKVNGVRNGGGIRAGGISDMGVVGQNRYNLRSDARQAAERHRQNQQQDPARWMDGGGTDWAAEDIGAGGAVQHRPHSPLHDMPHPQHNGVRSRDKLVQKHRYHDDASDDNVYDEPYEVSSGNIDELSVADEISECIDIMDDLSLVSDGSDQSPVVSKKPAKAKQKNRALGKLKQKMKSEVDNKQGKAGAQDNNPLSIDAVGIGGQKKTKASRYLDCYDI
jgi:kinesin family protein 18/19